MTNSKMLRDIIAESGLKLSHIAEKLNISSYCLSKKINNENEFKPSEILVLCNIMFIEKLEEKEAIFFAKRVD